jgi:three-Cys-motif partner protein
LASDLAQLRSDTVGPWSEHVKLAVLRSYLQSYMRVMEKQHWCTGGVHYIDGFAGTGQPFARGEDRRVDGSPRIALDLSQPFDSYTFIEREPWRVERLEELCSEYPHLKTHVIRGDCNEVIPRQVTPVVRREHYARGFAFLDPFALQLKCSTIEAIAETRGIEVVINVATLAMNRNGLPNDPRKLTQAHTDRMDGAWGDHSWYDLIYDERQGLWGPEVVKAGTTSAERLGRLFAQHRLAKIFRFVSEPRVVRDSGGRPIYCLVHASPNPVGKKIADAVLRKERPLPAAAPATLPLFPQ